MFKSEERRINVECITLMQMSFRNITNDLNERNIAVIVNTATFFI